MAQDIVKRIDFVLMGRTMLSEREMLLSDSKDEIQYLRRLNGLLFSKAVMAASEDCSKAKRKQLAQEILSLSDK